MLHRMNEMKVNCTTCGVEILQATFEKCGGLCMQCFMKENNGFKPEEFSRLNDRNLDAFWKEWKIFTEKDVPDTGKKSTNDELAHYIPILAATLNGYFRSESVDLNGKGQMHIISKLQAIKDEIVQDYINELLSFYEKATEYKNAT